MSTHAEPAHASKNKSPDSSVLQQRNCNHPSLQVEDNRPEAAVQMKLQTMANASPQVAKVQAFQEMANNHTAAVQRMAALQRLANTQQARPPIQRKQDTLKEQMGAQHGVDLSGVKEIPNSSFPESVGALATIQGNRIDYAPTQFTTANRKHEFGHAIDNAKNGTPKGDITVNGQKIDTTRENAAQKIADTPLHNQANPSTFHGAAEEGTDQRTETIPLQNQASQHSDSYTQLSVTDSVPLIVQRQPQEIPQEIEGKLFDHINFLDSNTQVVRLTIAQAGSGDDRWKTRQAGIDQKKSEIIDTNRQRNLEGVSGRKTPNGYVLDISGPMGSTLWVGPAGTSNSGDRDNKKSQKLIENTIRKAENEVKEKNEEAGRTVTLEVSIKAHSRGAVAAGQAASSVGKSMNNLVLFDPVPGQRGASEETIAADYNVNLETVPDSTVVYSARLNYGRSFRAMMAQNASRYIFVQDGHDVGKGGYFSYQDNGKLKYYKGKQLSRLPKGIFLTTQKETKGQIEGSDFANKKNKTYDVTEDRPLFRLKRIGDKIQDNEVLQALRAFLGAELYQDLPLAGGEATDLPTPLKTLYDTAASLYGEGDNVIKYAIEALNLESSIYRNSYEKARLLRAGEYLQLP